MIVAGYVLFCPKYTTDLDKYLGDKRVSLILTILAQLPNYKTFTLADYFYKRERDAEPISSFSECIGVGARTRSS